MRKAIIFTAPSGSGKTTLVRHLLERMPSLIFSISATTRPARSNEFNGRDYHFLSQEEFKNKADSGDFIEWEEVYKGTYYGTLKSEIERIWAAGKDVIFDVEVHGALNLKKYFGDKALAIFVNVPDLNTLRSRLKKRETETEESLNRRIEKATYEMSYEPQFDRTILNDDLEKAKAESFKLVKEFLD